MVSGLLARALVLLALVVCGGVGWAHKPSDSFLFFHAEEGRVVGQWDIAIRDMEAVIGLDQNEDGIVTLGEIKAGEPRIDAYAMGRFSAKVDGEPLALVLKGHRMTKHTDGDYIILDLEGVYPEGAKTLTLTYNLLFDTDPMHHGILRWGKEPDVQVRIFRPMDASMDFPLGAGEKLEPVGFGVLFREGVWHIWSGFDHLLFLLALLFPAVMKFEDGRWSGVDSFRPALVNLLKVVTSFTLAHSVTLGAATFDLVHLPDRFVESVVALSIVVATLNNFRPVVNHNMWAVAFVFGLIHGFGFAGSIAELDLGTTNLLTVVLGFNLGVEAGQLAVVLVFFPVAYALRSSWVYKNVVLLGGSGVIVLTAFGWFVERLFGLGFMPI